MENSLEIDLVQIKRVVDRLFAHLIDENGVQKLELKNSNYWNIPFPEVYQPELSESNSRLLDVGSLQDDWEFLSSLLDDATPPLVLQFTQVAPLLRYIGEILGNELAKDGG